MVDRFAGLQAVGREWAAPLGRASTFVRRRDAQVGPHGQDSIFGGNRASLSVRSINYTFRCCVIWAANLLQEAT